MSLNAEQERDVIAYLLPRVETLLRDIRQCNGGGDPRVDAMLQFETAGKMRQQLDTRLGLEASPGFGADVFKKAIDVAYQRL